MRSRFTALKGTGARLPALRPLRPDAQWQRRRRAGNGGPDSGAIATAGGHRLLVGSDPVTTTNAANRDYAVPVHSALDADVGFLDVSNGFAGRASDGLMQLDDAHRLSSRFDDRLGGQPRPDRRVDLPRDGRFELALGFGETQAGAVAQARGSLRERFRHLSRAYDQTWHRYDDRLIAPRRPRGVSSRRWRPLVDEYYLSANYVKAAEDKTFPGAVAAALASPWGQAVAAGDPTPRTSARTARCSRAISTRRGPR